MSNILALNRRARYNFFIEKELEAGLCLEGWEVKSLRAHRVQIQEAYITIKNREAWLIGSHISPLSTASTHITPQANRTRKLLLSARELNHITSLIQEKGYTIIPIKLYWKKKLAKLSIGIAKGKKLYDKRAAIKAKDWKREKERLARFA